MQLKADFEYGSVDGDINAKAIMQDRAVGQTAVIWIYAALQVGMIGCGIAYGTTGHPGWLAGLVLVSVWFLAGIIHQAAYPLMTWLQIVERRAQLIEQDANIIDEQLRNIQSMSEGRSRSEFG
jgi:hypothetical protein